MNPTYLLVDGNNLLMRSIHATTRTAMTTTTGVRTGAVHVFITTLAKHIRAERPTHVGVAWDCSGPSHRVQMMDSYKAARRDSPVADEKNTAFPLVKEFLSLAGLYHLEVPGEEADDLISAWWSHIDTVYPTDFPLPTRIKILSSDHDFFQLIGPNPHGAITSQVRFAPRGSIRVDRWTEADVIREHGCWPSRLPYVMALAGDPGDGIPGVRGLGPKKALKLLKDQDWDWPAVLASLEGQEGARETAERCLGLVDLRTHRLTLPPPPAVSYTDQHSLAWSQLVSFCTAYELHSILTLLTEQRLWTTSERLPGRPLRLEPRQS